jgi:hypothetical protein
MDFNLKPPDPKVTSMTFASQLLTGLKQKIDDSRSGKEPLASMSFRLEPELLKNFKKGCARHHIPQSRVLVAMMEAVVPIMLADPQPPQSSTVQAEDLQRFTELLRMALPQLVNAPGPGSDSSGSR